MERLLIDVCGRLVYCTPKFVYVVDGVHKSLTINFQPKAKQITKPTWGWSIESRYLNLNL